MSEVDPIEQKHRALAAEVVDLFIPDNTGLNEDETAAIEEENEPKIRAIFAKLDPVEAAAVAIQACFELDPEEIAELLAVLEDDGS